MPQITKGSMVFNSHGRAIHLFLDVNQATSKPDNQLAAVQRELLRIKASPSVNDEQVNFLNSWINIFTTQDFNPLPGQFKLGKNPPIIDPRTLQFRNYSKDLNPPPRYVDFQSLIPTYPMYSNDSLGDCVAAAAGHMVQNWTTYAGKTFTPSDQDIINFYEFSGYNPNDPSTDQGWELLPALKNWRASGLANHKIIAFVQLQTGNFNELKQAIALFGNAYLGFALPDFVVPSDGTDWTTIPWVWRAGSFADPSNGHCVPAMGYNKFKWLNFVSWGAKMPGMDEEFYKQSSDEAWAVVTEDWIESDGLSPSGFNVTQLLSDLDRVTK